MLWTYLCDFVRNLPWNWYSVIFQMYDSSTGESTLKKIYYSILSQLWVVDNNTIKNMYVLNISQKILIIFQKKLIFITWSFEVIQLASTFVSTKCHFHRYHWNVTLILYYFSKIFYTASGDITIIDCERNRNNLLLIQPRKGWFLEQNEC